MIRHTKNTSINVFSLSCWPTNQLKKASCFYCRLFSSFIDASISSFSALLCSFAFSALSSLFLSLSSSSSSSFKWDVLMSKIFHPRLFRSFIWSFLNAPICQTSKCLALCQLFSAGSNFSVFSEFNEWPQIVILTSNESCNKQLSAFPQHAENTGKTMTSLISLINICDRLSRYIRNSIRPTSVASAVTWNLLLLPVS